MTSFRMGDDKPATTEDNQHVDIDLVMSNSLPHINNLFSMFACVVINVLMYNAYD